MPSDQAGTVSTTLLPPDLVALLARQDGVVARFQALEEGLRAHQVERLLRRREWALLQPGVYVDHTGRPTWRQRAWGAVLGHWPAALFGASVLAATHSTGAAADLIHVGIDRTRARPARVPGVAVHFVTDLEARARWNLSPPRLRFEDAVLDLAASAENDLAAVAVLLDACGSRRTTAARLRSALDERCRISRRPWIEAVLTDAAEGTHSVLERGYRELERAHGLPQALRQCREETPTGVVYRDARYGRTATVELDGWAVHGRREQWEADLARDLEVAADGGVNVRLGYRQVYGTGCATIAAVIRFLRSRGIEVTPYACGAGCPVAAVLP